MKVWFQTGLALLLMVFVLSIFSLWGSSETSTYPSVEPKVSVFFKFLHSSTATLRIPSV